MKLLKNGLVDCWYFQLFVEKSEMFISESKPEVVLRKKLYKITIGWQFDSTVNVLFFSGSRGTECIKLNSKVIIFERCFFIKSNYINLFKRFLFYAISGIIFGWIVQFNIIGYHYTLRFSAKKRYLRINLGFRYKIFLILPSSIVIYGEKRKFALVGSNFIELHALAMYIRSLRNLLPYKLKGFCFLDEHVKLKQGKKLKYR